MLACNECHFLTLSSPTGISPSSKHTYVLKIANLSNKSGSQWGSMIKIFVEATDFFFLFRDTPVAYGSSQDRGQTRDTAASLGHSHRNTAGSKPCLRPTPLLTAKLDP